MTKTFYSIKEVASLLGETEPTLRYWENEFPSVITPRRNNRGVRSYTEKDLDDIRLIQYNIRNLGLTLDGVRKKLKNSKDFALRQAKIARQLAIIKKELLVFRDVFDEVEKRKHLM